MSASTKSPTVTDAASPSTTQDISPSNPPPITTMTAIPDPALAAYNIRSPAFWIVVVSVYLAFFLIALDRMIIATAIPTITNDFGSISDIGWYGSAYMLTCAIFNPLFGSIYRFYDTKWVFMISVVLFETGSALCGAAPTSAAFIAGRAIAGVGAAGKCLGAVQLEIRP
jgi:predicted MFS family arabinose efflux permease